MAAPSQKDNPFDAEKRRDPDAILPQHVEPARIQKPKAVFFRRFIRLTIVCVIVYHVHSSFQYLISPSSTSEHHNDQPGSEWAFDAFRPGRGPILNGRRAEEIFLKVPDALSAVKASRLYAGLAHMAGTDQDLETAKYVLQHFENSFGIERTAEEPIFPAGSAESRAATLDIVKAKEPRAWIDIYYPVLSTPGERRLEVLDEDSNSVWTADIEEHGDPLDEDATNSLPEAPVFHGLSKGGDVSGELVSASYCRPGDFEAAENAGVNFSGKIVLCRYGELFRGLKVKGAQDRGAVGVLIYSDTRDDGSVTVENGYEPYPIGPARNPTSVQRGSVQFLSVYPGDPTTPGYPSYENSTRTEGTNIPDIPSLPISSANAQKLLEVAKDGKRVVRLLNEANHAVTPIWNTMAVIPGHIKDEVVMIGNHRDAWVLGATDPSSGTVSVHEVVRGFAELYKNGWRPLRTILLASWDAEEYGLIGSTEWAEDFPEWIQDNVVAYINLDSSVSGARFNVGGSPSMAHLLRGAALRVPHPTDPTRTVWDARSDNGPFAGPVDPEYEALTAAKDAAEEPGLGVHPLGSGSDYTAFLQRLGIASSDGGFGRTNSDAVYHYHSIYDSQRSQELYLDPGFHRHVAVAQYVGLTALRLADSIVLPLNTTFYSEQLSNYVDQVAKIISASDISVDLSPLRKSVGKLQRASLKLDKEKTNAEKQLWKIIRRWQRRHRHPHHPHHPPLGAPHPSPEAPHPSPPHHDLDEERSDFTEFSPQRRQRHACHGSRWRKFNGFVRNLFGMEDDKEEYTPFDVESSHPPHAHPPPPPPTGPDHPPPHHPPPHHRPHRRPHHRRPSRRLIKAIKRVQAVNKKLAGFESGFISKEGLLEREWYKHLGVAPGKWLGYGSTTLPGLTEAFTIEHNATLAKYELERLTTLLDALAEDIHV